MTPSQDDLIKNLLLQPRFLEAFFRAFLPEIFDFADFEVLEYIDKEHPRAGRKPRRRGDLLIKVKWKHGEGLFLIHIESQGQPQEVIMLRLMEYCLRDSIQYSLPVMPVLLLTYDSPKSKVPQQLNWRFGKLASIQVKCPVLHFQRMDPAPFLASSNIAGLTLANLMSVSAEQQVDGIVQAMAESLLQKLSSSEADAVREFIMSVKELSHTQLLQIDEKMTTLAQQDKRLNRMPKLINPFIEIGKIKGRTEGREEGMQQGMRQGLQQGRQEGREEAELALVLRLLKKKYPTLAAKVTPKVKKMDEETLLSFGEALLFMQSTADCQAWLKDNA
jgi:hypothetical protein